MSPVTVMATVTATAIVLVAVQLQSELGLWRKRERGVWGLLTVRVAGWRSLEEVKNLKLTSGPSGVLILAVYPPQRVE